jgi:predicted DNA binding CopG/RHH family protein
MLRFAVEYGIYYMYELCIMNRKHKAGEIKVSAEEFEPKNLKIRITTMLDGDVLEACKMQADKEHVGYQTLINKILRERLLGAVGIEQRIMTLEAAFAALNRAAIGTTRVRETVRHSRSGRVRSSSVASKRRSA